MPNPSPKLLTERVPLLLTPEEVAVMDALRAARPVPLSRNALVRTMLHEEAARQTRRTARAQTAPAGGGEENGANQ